MNNNYCLHCGQVLTEDDEFCSEECQVSHDTVIMSLVYGGF